MLNAWVLSLIICSATPLPGGGYCETRTVDYALSREECKAALSAEKQRIKAPMRLECTEDPALSAALEEMNSPDDATPPLSRANIRAARQRPIPGSWRRLRPPSLSIQSGIPRA